MMSKVSAFVGYALIAAYRNREDKSKFCMTISRKSLAHVLGGKVLGPVQKEQLREACIDNEVGFSEHNERLMFFDLSRMEEFSIQMGRPRWRPDQTTGSRSPQSANVACR